MTLLSLSAFDRNFRGTGVSVQSVDVQQPADHAQLGRLLQPAQTAPHHTRSVFAEREIFGQFSVLSLVA